MNLQQNMQEPKVNQEATDIPEIDPIDLANAMCRPVLALNLGEDVRIPHPLGRTKTILRKYLPRIRYHRLTFTEIEGGCIVKFEPRKRPAAKPVGRPESKDSFKAQLLAIPIGGHVIMRNVNPMTLSSMASVLRRQGRASFKITYSDQEPPAAKVERIDGLTVEDGYGQTIRLDQIQDRSPLPFRSMQPGDRFTVLLALHAGMANMRATCSKFGKLCGYRFLPEAHRDGSITVQCLAKLNAERTDEQIADDIRRSKKEPAIITLIW